jgi:3-(3-hydroxy-phenyl)propionate hydroxylase
LQTPDGEAEGLAPGSPCLDAPVENGRSGWLLDHLGGDFAILTIGDEPLSGIDGIRQVIVAGEPRQGALHDRAGHARRRYGAGLSYLIRPDQHVAARFRRADPDAVGAAHARASGWKL